MYSAVVPNWIHLQEPPERRRVEPGLVIPQAELGHPRLPRISEPPEMRPARYAIFVVGVGGDGVAPHVDHSDDRALVVGEQDPPPAFRENVVPDERVVRPRIVAVDVAVGEGPGAVIFDDQSVAVVDEAADSGGARHLGETAERVVDELGIVGARGGDQTVLDVVDVSGRRRRVHARGEVAVRIVAERRGARRQILVLAVHRMGPRRARPARPGISVVARRAGQDLARRVVGEAEGEVAVRAERVVGEALEPARRIVAIDDPAPGHGRAPPEIVIGEACDRIVAVAAHPGRPPEPVQIVGDVDRIGMGEPCPVAVPVVEGRDRARRPAHVARARHQPPEPVIGVGDPLAADMVEPGLGLEAPKVVIVDLKTDLL